MRGCRCQPVRPGPLVTPLNVAVSNYGVIAVYGGSVYGGSAGWLGRHVGVSGWRLPVDAAGGQWTAQQTAPRLPFCSTRSATSTCGSDRKRRPITGPRMAGSRPTPSTTIQQWGPLVNPSFSLTTLSPGYSACAPINYQGGAAAAPGSGSSSSGGAAPPPSGGGGLFDLLQQPQMNQSIYNRVASAMASLVAPVVWEANQQQTQVAQLTTWLLWGTQPDVDITLNAGLNFTTIAGSSTFTYLGNTDFENDFGLRVWRQWMPAPQHVQPLLLDGQHQQHSVQLGIGRWLHLAADPRPEHHRGLVQPHRLLVHWLCGDGAGCGVQLGGSGHLPEHEPGRDLLPGAAHRRDVPPSPVLRLRHLLARRLVGPMSCSSWQDAPT